jgi:hypothetical protein
MWQKYYIINIWVVENRCSLLIGKMSFESKIRENWKADKSSYKNESRSQSQL